MTIALLGCGAGAPADSCDTTEWVAATDPMAIAIRASGAVSWESGGGRGPLTIAGTLVSAEDDTTLRFDTADGELTIEIDVARARLGVLPIGSAVDVTLDEGVVLADAEGMIALAVISSRGHGDVIAANVTLRQAYAECVVARCASEPCDGCFRVMASPLVDVVTGASTLRLPPGSTWRVPSDEDASAEIEIVRSVRAAAPDELDGLPEPRCADLPADELAVIVRRLR